MNREANGHLDVLRAEIRRKHWAENVEVSKSPVAEVHLGRQREVPPQRYVVTHADQPPHAGGRGVEDIAIEDIEVNPC